MQVKFNENNIAYVTFYKWDYGQELSFDSVPENSEVHFPVKGSEDAAVVRVTGNKCLVPNATLSMDLSSFDAWLYIDNGEQGKTKKTIHFTLIQRARPDGHIYSFELDQLLSLDGKLDKHQGAENAGKTFIIDNNGNAVVDHIPSIEIDSKLSENSSNPIANSAVAKVLSGGKLVCIKTAYDYEEFMDAYSLFYDFEKEVILLSEGEYIILFITCDIDDEELGHVGAGTYILGVNNEGDSYETFFGAVDPYEITQINDKINSNSTSIRSLSNSINGFATKTSVNEMFEKLQNVLTLPENHISVATYILRGAGIYIIDCETTEIVIGSAKKHLITMSKGEIFMVAESRSTGTYVRSVAAFTKQGLKYFPDVNAEDLEICRYLTNTETEKLVDDKLLEFENSSVNKKYRLIADITTTEDTTYVLTTKDTNDNDFCLKKAKIFIETPAASAAEGILVKMSDVYENGTVTGGTLIIQLNAISTTARYCTIDIEANEYGAFAKGTQGTSMVLQNSVSGGYNPNVTAISKLLIRAHNAGNMLPAGTKIKIWGY